MKLHLFAVACLAASHLAQGLVLGSREQAGRESYPPVECALAQTDVDGWEKIEAMLKPQPGPLPKNCPRPPMVAIKHILDHEAKKRYKKHKRDARDREKRISKKYKNKISDLKKKLEAERRKNVKSSATIKAKAEAKKEEEKAKKTEP